ncbi:MAG: hypothetical protein V1911_03370, partial [Candidatus Micrarchaeota archaeon]
SFSFPSQEPRVGGGEIIERINAPERKITVIQKKQAPSAVPAQQAGKKSFFSGFFYKKSAAPAPAKSGKNLSAPVRDAIKEIESGKAGYRPAAPGKAPALRAALSTAKSAASPAKSSPSSAQMKTDELVEQAKVSMSNKAGKSIADGGIMSWLLGVPKKPESAASSYSSSGMSGASGGQPAELDKFMKSAGESSRPERARASRKGAEENKPEKKKEVEKPKRGSDNEQETVQKKELPALEEFSLEEGGEESGLDLSDLNTASDISELAELGDMENLESSELGEEFSLDNLAGVSKAKEVEKKKGMGCPQCGATKGIVIYCPYCGSGFCSDCSGKVERRNDLVMYKCATCKKEVLVKA